MATSRSRSKVKRRRNITLFVAGLLLIIQFLLSFLIFYWPENGFWIYWFPFYNLVFLLVTIVPIFTIISVFIAFTQLMRFLNLYIAVLISTLFSVPLIFLCLVSFSVWIFMGYGVGNNKIIAEVKDRGTLYRLDYSAAGDPPMSSYHFYECDPTGWLCRQLGSFYPPDDQLFERLAPAEMLGTGEKLTIVIDGTSAAHYTSGKFKCVQTNRFRCSER